MSSQNLTINEETAQLDPTMSFDVYVPELHYFNNSMMQSSMNEQQILHQPNFVSPDTSQVEIEPDDIYNKSLQQTDEKVRKGHLNQTVVNDGPSKRKSDAKAPPKLPE